VIHLVDTVEVRPEDVDAYLRAFTEFYLPGAKERGMELVACWHTPAEIGENVSVIVVFALESWAEWERIRNAGVRDPRMSTWVERRRALMLNGSRRFYEPAPSV
jgi:NIPSNAP protein